MSHTQIPCKTARCMTPSIPEAEASLSEANASLIYSVLRTAWATQRNLSYKTKRWGLARCVWEVQTGRSMWLKGQASPAELVYRLGLITRAHGRVVGSPSSPMGKPAQTHMNEVFFLRFPSGRWVLFLSRALKSQQSVFPQSGKLFLIPTWGCQSFMNTWFQQSFIYLCFSK